MVTPIKTSTRMHVVKYLPEKLYGFCQDGAGLEVFFHLGVFQPGHHSGVVRCPNCPGLPMCCVSEVAPPPILGEQVFVDYETPGSTTNMAPRATSVVRDSPPQMLLGRVHTFDAYRRYGFVLGSDLVSYHLHQSEIAEGGLPLPGQQVTFFSGVREGRPRACHVRICR